MKPVCYGVSTLCQKEEVWQLSYQDEPDPIPEDMNRSVSVVKTRNMKNVFAALTNSLWPVPESVDYVLLKNVAYLENGKSITKQEILPGNIPVIAGGGSSPYNHKNFTHRGNCFTISKSGAYSCYVWWHSGPIWASDSIVVYSRDEFKFLTGYLYACVKSRQNEIYSRQQGTGQPHIYKKHIECIPIPVIPIDNQREMVKEFFEALEEFEAQKELLDTEHDRLLRVLREQL